MPNSEDFNWVVTHEHKNSTLWAAISFISIRRVNNKIEPIGKEHQIDPSYGHKHLSFEQFDEKIIMMRPSICTNWPKACKFEVLGVYMKDGNVIDSVEGMRSALSLRKSYNMTKKR